MEREEIVEGMLFRDLDGEKRGRGMRSLEVVTVDPETPSAPMDRERSARVKNTLTGRHTWVPLSRLCKPYRYALVGVPSKIPVEAAGA